MPRPRALPSLVIAALLVPALLLAPTARAEVGDYGWAGPSFSGAGSSPTAEKPESKLWWNDGFWWASLFSPTAGVYRIHRLDPTTQQWIDTGVPLDARSGSSADVLWHAPSNKLYVASQGSGGAWLFRYSYNPATDTYTNDAGAGTSNRLAVITTTNPETITIDRDSTGQLWATWESGGAVRVNRTTTSDAVWGTEFTLPVQQATGLDSDDISAVVAFDDDKIGVMWSHQPGNRMLFAVHHDSAPDTTWEASMIAFGGGGQPDADDHINLKALHADPNSDRIYAAIKTSRTRGSDPLVVLLRYDRSEGWWDSAVFGTEDDDHTRPVIMLDTTNRLVHMFATSPTKEAIGQTVYCKVTNMDAPRGAISFPAGLGQPVMRDASHAINNASGAKQNVSSQTGLVVLGGSSAGRYWHHYNALTTPGCNGASDPGGDGGGGGNTAPVAVDDTYTTPAGTTLTVPAASGVLANDSDADGDSLTAVEVSDPGNRVTLNPNGSFSYAPPAGFSGSYAFTYTANDAAAASNVATVTITVTPVGNPGPSTTFTPSHDTYVRSNAAGENNGSAVTLRAYLKGKNETRSYLRFEVSGLTAPAPATLRLWVTKSSPDGGVLHLTGTSWSESTLTWTTSPALGTQLAALGPVTAGTWVELDVGTLGNGTHAFAIRGTSSTVAYYSSKEGPEPAQLVIGGN